MSSHWKNPSLTTYILQRLTGVMLAAFLFIHLITIIFAVKGGLSVAEIVDRVRGNIGWIAFYGIFILTVVIHATIGLRNIISELTSIDERTIGLISSAYAIIALILGYFALRAIW